VTGGRRAGLDVVVVGQGYVGLPVAMRAAEVGHSVVGFDVDAERVKSLAAGCSYVHDVSSERLQAALASAYRPSAEAADCRGFQVAVVAVPTPLSEGAPDLSYIESAARTLAPFVDRGACVVLESTTYPGTTEEMFGPILEEGSGLVAGDDFFLGYSPERIDPGNHDWPFERVPKVVSGIDEKSLEAVRDFYETLVARTVPVSSVRVAELTKLIENTFRHVNIALVNELAMYANDLGISVWEAIDAASTKPFGYMRFTPGPGVGGHCLPIDPSYLSWKVRRTLGHTFRFVELAGDVNDHMPDYVVRRVSYALNKRRKAVNGSRILILGLAYKRNTNDARQSPGAVVAERLAVMGASVRVCDPLVGEHPMDALVERVDCTTDEIGAADAVILLADHDSFDYDAVVQHAAYVFDARNRLRGSNVEHL